MLDNDFPGFAQQVRALEALTHSGWLTYLPGHVLDLWRMAHAAIGTQSSHRKRHVDARRHMRLFQALPGADPAGFAPCLCGFVNLSICDNLANADIHVVSFLCRAV